MTIRVLVNGLAQEKGTLFARLIDEHPSLTLCDYSLDLQGVPGGFLYPFEGIRGHRNPGIRAVEPLAWEVVLSRMRSESQSFWNGKTRVYALDFLGEDRLINLYHQVELPYAYVGPTAPHIEALMVAEHPLAIYAPCYDTLAPLINLHKTCNSAAVYQGPLPAMKEKITSSE